MTPPTPYRDGHLYVCDRPCETCVFRPGNVMDLTPGRLRDIIDTNLSRGSALTCHRTIYEDPDEQHAICRGFFDRFKDRSEALGLADRLGIVKYLSPPRKH